MLIFTFYGGRKNGGPHRLNATQVYMPWRLRLGYVVIVFLPKVDMTIPRVTNDLLMLLPSFNRSPDAPLALALSLSAKTTITFTDNDNDDNDDADDYEDDADEDDDGIGGVVR
jgi:hypothetical protein